MKSWVDFLVQCCCISFMCSQAILYHLYLTIWLLDCAAVFQAHHCVSCIEWLSSCSQVNYKIHNVQVVTFGQPRIGNTAFASRYSKLVPNTIRVTNKHDIVPHLPPYYPRLTQKTYHHFPREVIFSVHILSWLFLQPFLLDSYPVKFNHVNMIANILEFMNVPEQLMQKRTSINLKC